MIENVKKFVHKEFETFRGSNQVNSAKDFKKISLILPLTNTRKLKTQNLFFSHN